MSRPKAGAKGAVPASRAEDAAKAGAPVRRSKAGAKAGAPASRLKAGAKGAVPASRSNAGAKGTAPVSRSKDAAGRADPVIRPKGAAPTGRPREAAQGAAARIEFELRGEHIALDSLLKATGLAESGGAAKQAITGGMVRVDGQVELRRGCKLRAGQVVEAAGAWIRIAAAGGFSEGGTAPDQGA